MQVCICQQRRRRRSGWSGLGRTTFQRVAPRLKGQSEDEMIGPGVHANSPLPCVYAFLVYSLPLFCRRIRSPARPDQTVSAVRTYVMLNTDAYSNQWRSYTRAHTGLGPGEFLRALVNHLRSKYLNPVA